MTAKPNFERDALGLLKKFVRGQRGRSFCAESFTKHAIEKGVAPADLRTFGKVFTVAQRENIIRRSMEPFRRSFGNGSLTFGWVAA